MINYLEYQISQMAQHSLELFAAQPLHDFRVMDFTAFEYEACCQDEENLQHNVTPETENIENLKPVEESQQPILRVGQNSEEMEGLKAQEISQQSKQKAKMQRRAKNETKNIPKNFGKGIISFIQKNQRKIRGLLQKHKLPFNSFKLMMKGQKKVINTIADLRRLWTEPTYGKVLRIISNLFFRRHSMDYIFNSRISNYSSHIKYRQSLWEALKNPWEFNHIKEF